MASLAMLVSGGLSFALSALGIFRMRSAAQDLQFETRQVQAALASEEQQVKVITNNNNNNETSSRTAQSQTKQQGEASPTKPSLNAKQKTARQQYFEMLSKGDSADADGETNYYRVMPLAYDAVVVPQLIAASLEHEQDMQEKNKSNAKLATETSSNTSKQHEQERLKRLNALLNMSEKELKSSILARLPGKATSAVASRATSTAVTG